MKNNVSIINVFVITLAFILGSCEKETVDENYLVDQEFLNNIEVSSDCSGCDVLVDPGDGGGGGTGSDCNDLYGITGDCNTGTYYYQTKKDCLHTIRISGEYSRNSSGTLAGTIDATGATSDNSSTVTILSQSINPNSDSSKLSASVYYKITTCQSWYEPNGTEQGTNCQDYYYSSTVTLDPCNGTIQK